MTGRLPFDGGRVRRPATTPKPAAPAGATISVSRLAELIDQALRDRLPDRVRVVGELSNVNHRTHWYFTMKDQDAVVDCVMFAAAARNIGFRPAVGMRVIATGSVNHYAKQGRTQLYAIRLEQAGDGDLQAKLRELVRQLTAEGYLDPERKKPLPMMPRRVAVITSETSAALQDVLDTLRQRCPAVGVLVCDVRVQGDDAAPQIARTLAHLSDRREELGIDAIILTRGGGSMEDLWAFNERLVADALVRTPIPVVAAIGHETDTTIAELVADRRAATPTQAAMLLSPDRAALREQVDQFVRRIASLTARTSAACRDRLRASAGRRLFRQPAAVLVETQFERLAVFERHLARSVAQRLRDDHLHLARLGSRLAALRPEALQSQRTTRLALLEARLARAIDLRQHRRALAERTDRLVRAAAHVPARERDRLSALDRELAMVGPARVLARGYSVTTDATGRVVRSVNDLHAGDRMRTRLADGTLDSTVGPAGTEPSSAAPARPTPAPPPRRRSRSARSRGKGHDPNQRRLF